MTLLPIVERELRVAARKRATYWTRASIALLATIVVVATFLASLADPAANFGQLLFWGLAGLSMIYCLVAGMTYGEFWRMVVLLVDTFLFSPAVGMFASAISRDYQRAMAGTSRLSC